MEQEVQVPAGWGALQSHKGKSQVTGGYMMTYGPAVALLTYIAITLTAVLVVVEGIRADINNKNKDTDHDEG